MSVRSPLKWTLIEPENAVGLDLRTDKDILGPLNDKGEVCPWPWETQQAKFSPAGTHTCSYCGQQSTPGLEHPDFRSLIEGDDR